MSNSYNQTRQSGYVYEIELVDESGVVWELKYDAKTGELMSTKEENSSFSG